VKELQGSESLELPSNPSDHIKFQISTDLPNALSATDSLSISFDEYLRNEEAKRKKIELEREQNRKDKEFDYEQKRKQFLDYAAGSIVCATALTAIIMLIQNPQQPNKDWQGILTTTAAVATGYLFGSGKKSS
jgi:hypothetical protein